MWTMTKFLLRVELHLPAHMQRHGGFVSKKWPKKRNGIVVCLLIRCRLIVTHARGSFQGSGHREIFSSLQ